MRYCYAQLDESGVCIAVVDTFDPIESPLMIPVESASDSYLFCTYADGVFTPPAES